MSKIRAQVSLGTDLNKWLENKALEMGITKSALMNVAICQWKDNQIGLEAVELEILKFKEDKKNDK